MKSFRFPLCRFLLVLVAFSPGLLGCEYFEFPGTVVDPGLTYETDPDGIRSFFREGEVYRHPGIMPMLRVAGGHYEMGLQYGVLLRPEILDSLDAYEQLLYHFAEEEGIPFPAFTAFVKFMSAHIAKKLPARFRDEIRGVSNGSGVPYTSVLAVSLIYDVLEAAGCTGILMKGEGGTIIHGRNQDWFALEALADVTVIVEHNAEGFHSVTHMDWILGMGVETGYNDQGLAFSEETISVKQPNASGFSLVYLSRMALEESANLEEVKAVFDRCPVIGGYGTVWSDRDTGEGMVIEASPTRWAAHAMEGSILSNFNHYYDGSLTAEHQPVWKYLSGADWDREYIASGFPYKSVYTVADAVDFMRGQVAPDGSNFAWHGSTNPVCNDSGWQMIVFDPAGDGFYYAWGRSYACNRDCYRFYQDFSIRPTLYAAGVPIEPEMEDAARIVNSLYTEEQRLAAYVDLAAAYPEDANARFWVAHESFEQKRLNEYGGYAIDAFSMDPSVPEYGLYAGMARYGQGDPASAITVLEGIDTSLFTPLQRIYRACVLERSYAPTNPAMAEQYRLERESILSLYDANEYFQETILPKINALDGTG